MTEAVAADLAAIRVRGHEIVDSFVIKGVVNISAPIIDHTGHADRRADGAAYRTVRRSGQLLGLLRATIDCAARLTRSVGGGVVGEVPGESFSRT